MKKVLFLSVLLFASGLVHAADGTVASAIAMAPVDGGGTVLMTKPGGTAMEIKGEGIMGMKVEGVVSTPGKIIVTTTGARYVFDGASNEIACYQRIGGERLVGTVKFPGTPPDLRLAELKVEKADADECLLSAGKVRVIVRNDSYLRFDGLGDRKPVLESALKNARGRDDEGVHGLFDGKGGTLVYRDVAAFAVMPPREFDFDMYFGLRANQLGSEWGLKGTDLVIEENVKRGVNLFVIWSSACWETAQYDANKPFVPVEEDELKRVIAKIHGLKARVVLYTINGMIGNRASPEIFLKRMGELVDQFGADGVYDDEATKNWSQEQLYDFLRAQKKSYPKLLCIFHRPSNPLAEAYIDAKVIGEFGGSVVADDMDSRQWSNTVVLWIVDHNMGRTVKAVDTLLACRSHMYWPASGLPLNDLPGGNADYSRLWENYYAPRLDLMQLEHLRETGKLAEGDYSARKKAAEARITEFKESKVDQKAKSLPGLTGKFAVSSQAGKVYSPRDYAPELAADGSITTCWLAAEKWGHEYNWSSNHKITLDSLTLENMAKEWLSVDLGKEVDVKKVLYDTHYPCAEEKEVWQEAFRISVSLDGKSWRPVMEKNGLTMAERFEMFLPEVVKARYLRVDGIHTKSARVPFWHQAYVTELQVYDK